MSDQEGCEYYVSIDQPRCGKEAMGVELRMPGGKIYLELCAEHKITARAIQSATAARRRNENRFAAARRRRSAR